MADPKSTSSNTPKASDRTLDKFKGKLSGGGARPNLFECELVFPDNIISSTSTDFDEKIRFMVKAASLPASNLGIIDIPFRGRNLKIAGDRTFDPWTITVINDTDFDIRTAFERWMNLMNKHEDVSGITDPGKYQTDVMVKQFGRTNVTAPTFTSDAASIPVLKQYKFYGVFPTMVSDIPLSYESSDTIEEFTVDLQVQWWDALDGTGATQLGTNITTVAK